MKPALQVLIPLLLLGSKAFAQVHSDIRDFVPKGWEIEYSLKTDLTNDGLPDEALVIVERIGEDKYGNRNLLALKNTGSGFELIGKNDSGLLSSANVDSEVDAIRKGDSSITMQSKHGTLIIREGAHFGIHTNESQFTFRYNPKYNRMQEIGADCSNFERDGYGDDDISINFLTGIMNEEKSVLDKHDKATDRLTKSRKRIPKQLIWMENAVAADDERFSSR